MRVVRTAKFSEFAGFNIAHREMRITVSPCIVASSSSGSMKSGYTDSSHRLKRPAESFRHRFGMLIFSLAFALHSENCHHAITQHDVILRVCLRGVGGRPQFQRRRSQTLDLSQLNPGSRFEISTTDRVYRGEMVDPTTGEARLAASRDGVQFSEPQTVFLLGATQGRRPRPAD